jgi:hypothetical protein
MFQFKHHAIPVLEIMAINRIIDATARLTGAIVGIQDTPPNKMEAIQCLRTILLGKVAPLPPPALSILPTPQEPTPLVDIDEPVIIRNPQLVQPSLPPLKHNTNNIIPNPNTPAIIEDDSDDNTPISNHSMHPSCHHLIRPLQNHPLMHNQLRLCSAHMIDCVIADELMPTPSLCTHPPLLYCGYAFAAESILLETISPTSHSTIDFIGAIIDNDTGNVLEYQHRMKMDKHNHVCAHDFANEIGGLFQGIRNVHGTDTCFFIPKSYVPAHKRPTYGQICCNYQQQKEDEHCVRLIIGGDCIVYPGNKSTPTADLAMAKLLINSTISTPGAMFLGIDLASFYLNTPMPNPEYMRLHLDIIPDKNHCPLQPSRHSHS